MQAAAPFEMAPYSPPLDPPPASRRPSSSSLEHSLGNYSGASTATMERTGSALSHSRLDKGKQVQRDSSAIIDDLDDDATRQRRADRVLKRAEAAKLARAFRNRLALAGFKAQRGWQDATLDQIEPHMEQEALRRRSQSVDPNGVPPPAPPPQQHAPMQQYQQQQHQQVYVPEASVYAPPPQFQPHPSPYDQQGLYGIPSQPPPQQQFQSHPHHSMDAMLGGSIGPSSSLSNKRPRQDQFSPVTNQQAFNSYSNASVYAPQPQPVQHVSPYSTASVYQSAPAASGSFSPGGDGLARPNKRRLGQDSPAPGSRIGQASPRARTKSGRRASPAKNGRASLHAQAANDVASSDPSFSSFVDAAAALTGMARAPSDPSMNGSDEEQQQQHLYQQQNFLGNGAFEPLPLPPQPHHNPLSHSTLSHAHSPLANGNGFPPPPTSASPFPPRPSTPDRPHPLASKQPGAPGGSAGEGTAAEAADLMLFLAHSPSPQQTRKTNPTALGEGTGIKGRRLFSGVGMGGGGGADEFGGELGGGGGKGLGGELDAPFAPSPTTAAPEPTKPSSSAHAASSLPAPPSSALNGLDLAPATPGRNRKPSQSWENFINASPSPTRGGLGGGTRRTSAPGGIAGGAEGEGGSPPLGEMGAAVGAEAGVAW
ncbi:hypothetical protein JCM8547_007429 [Rhodosporidiobolus lusitaniae]